MSAVLLRTAVMSALAMAGCAEARAQSPAGPPSVEPIAGLEGGKIAVCGARMRFEAEGSTLTVEVMIRREGTGAKFQLRAAPEPQVSAFLDMQDVSLTTASASSAAIFQLPPRFDKALALYHESDANDERVTRLMQELMVGGGAIKIVREAWEPLELEIKGPLPQDTRAAYLNCAGDLFRPAE